MCEIRQNSFLFHYLIAILSEIVDFLAFSFFSFSRTEIYLYLSQPVVIGSSILFVDQVVLTHVQDVLGDCWLA